jgi:hypothetical protein
MDDRDEIWLPDGRVMPYRRREDTAEPAQRGAVTPRPPAAPRASGERARPSRDRRRRPRSNADCGRRVDLVT